MKIAVLCGSSKQAKNSNTMQYLFYLAKHFPKHDFSFLNVGFFFNSVTPDMQFFEESMKTIKNSDAVLWAFPVYFGLVPFSLKQFIEKVFETKRQLIFKDKYTASFSTSIHILDDVAHAYLRGICEDWEMNYYGFFSVDIYDYFSSKKMKDLTIFTDCFFSAVSQNEPCQIFFQKNHDTPAKYVPGKSFNKISLKNKRLLLIEHCLTPESNIKKMTSRFESQFAEKIPVIQLQSLGLKTGCYGCLKCGYNNICPLEDFPSISNVNSQIKQSDIIIFSGEVKDRFFSSLWKLFFDRSFSRGHLSGKLQGKQVGFIASGPFFNSNILNKFFVSFAEISGANLVGIVSDESNCSKTIDRLLHILSTNSVSFSEKNYSSPVTSSGLGTIKITRDNIYGRLSSVFHADHSLFKKSGLFDFPQNQRLSWYRNRLILLLLKLPYLRKLYYDRLPSLLPFLYKKFGQRKK